MRRLLLVTTSYPDGGEGEAAAGVFVQDFARALVAAGVDVMVIAPSVDVSGRVEEGVGVTRFAVPRLPLSLLSPLQPRDWGAIMATLTGGQRAVMRACEQFRPDHILALWVLPSGQWARRAARRYGIHYSTWALGSDIWTLGSIPVVRTLLRHVLRDSMACYADGFELANDVVRHGGAECGFLPSSRAMAPVTNKVLRDAPPYRLAFLGRWHPNKGVDLLIDALRLLGDDDWSLIESVRIYGGGPMESSVITGVDRLAGAGRPVTAGGYLDRSAAVQLLADVDYLIVPSRIESIPVIFSDAAQTGCGVIATPVGDLPRLLNDQPCGVLAEAVDADAIAAAVRRALAVPPSSLRDGMAYWARQFDIATAARNFLSGMRGHDDDSLSGTG